MVHEALHNVTDCSLSLLSVICLTALPHSHVALSVPSACQAYSCLRAMGFLLAVMFCEDFFVVGSLVFRFQTSTLRYNETFQSSVASKQQPSVLLMDLQFEQVFTGKMHFAPCSIHWGKSTEN